MGWLGESEYNCPECDGNKEVECGECGCIHECENCNGTGLDPEKIDIKRYASACDELNKESNASWAWIEGGKKLGRMSKCGRVAISDFVWK